MLGPAVKPSLVRAPAPAWGNACRLMGSQVARSVFVSHRDNIRGVQGVQETPAWN
jgi:hypothetical protein